MSKKLNEYAAFVLALRSKLVHRSPTNCDKLAIECADKLRRLAMALQRHHEAQCSVDGYDPDEAIAGRLLHRATKLQNEYGIDLQVSGDPRGYALRVMGLGVWNTWGGEEGGYGVPEE